MRSMLLLLGVCSMASPVKAQEADLAVLPTLATGNAAEQFPALFDEFLLTAVQATARVPVIGKDDIDAVLGFERTKELMGCDDVACMADVGGALGVSRLVHAKVDKLDQGKGNWVITTKLIITAGPTVEARTSDFVSGGSQELLQAIPAVVRKLFAGGGMGIAEPAETTASPEATPPERTSPPEETSPPPIAPPFEEAPVAYAPVYDPSYGGGSRALGVVLVVAGVAAGIAGAAMAVSGANGVSESIIDDCGDTEECFDTNRGDYMPEIAPGVGIAAVGLLACGLGQGIYLNGRAVAYTEGAETSGGHSLTWLGWFLAGAAVVFPLLDAAVGIEPLGEAGGALGLIGSTGIFAYTMMSSSAYYRSPTTGAEYPMARLFMLRDHNHRTVPAYGFVLGF